MKKIIKRLFFGLMWGWSKVFSYKLSQTLRKQRDVIYTSWIRSSFADLPLDSLIAYPCCLQGGGNKRIKIGNRTCVGKHSVFDCWVKYGPHQFNPEITIGDDCSIGEYFHVSAINSVTIGNGLLTGRFVYIGDNAHGGLSWEEAEVAPINRPVQSKGAVSVGNHVWIGDKATILGGVTIGDNVIIGANSVVTHDVPSHCMVAGAPAKIVRQLKESK